MEKLENIISTYQQIIQESEQALQRARKRIYYISLLRLVLFVEAIAGSLYLLERRLVISFRLCHSAFYIHLSGW